MEGSILTSSPLTSSEGSTRPKALNVGCGNRKPIRLIKHTPAVPDPIWYNLDIDPNVKQENLIQFDLNCRPWPFPDEFFDEVHAYEVMEHLGTQGDYKRFFSDMWEVYRLLKPNGAFYMTVPSAKSEWVWGDPGHTRHITPDTMMFLGQDFYNQTGETTASDYRWCWKGNIKAEFIDDTGKTFYYLGRAIK